MKRIFTYCFDKWWRPILFYGLSVTLLIISLFINGLIGLIINYSGLLLFGFGLLGLFISTIYHLSKKHWQKGILTGLLFAASTMVIIIMTFMVYSFGHFLEEQDSPDHFADNLNIPTNIQIDNPIDLGFDNQRPNKITNRKISQTDFQLYNSFQPGLYEYDFWTGKIESGTIYIKAYEITQEYALSSTRLPERSSVGIFNPTDSIMKFGTTTDFTIFEGDWGKPYAARFEVWFKPDNGGHERRLFEKNYKIEGWMR
jgi:hypothetical protein